MLSAKVRDLADSGCAGPRQDSDAQRQALPTSPSSSVALRAMHCPAVIRAALTHVPARKTGAVIAQTMQDDGSEDLSKSHAAARPRGLGFMQAWVGVAVCFSSHMEWAALFPRIIGSLQKTQVDGYAESATTGSIRGCARISGMGRTGSSLVLHAGQGPGSRQTIWAKGRLPKGVSNRPCSNWAGMV
ncbi:hypothetical protein BC628DRAFT_425485 [Trametes gibbosa]|nr:hypothetical protein BC628DRAFT_425485 [Trametes gibbosa]